MIYLILIVYLAIRVIPMIYYQVPLGYDPGLYLALFKAYQKIPVSEFLHLPDWMVEVFPPLLPVLMRFLTPIVASEKWIVVLPILISMALFGAVYYSVKYLFGQKTALITLVLLTLSIIQFKFYWYFYLKNILALALTMLMIVALRKQSKWAMILSAMIVLLHQPTAIIMLIILVWRKMDRVSFAAIMSAIGVGLLYYLPSSRLTLAPYLPAMLQSLTPRGYGHESGSFYGLGQSLYYALPYLPWAIVSIWQRAWGKNRELSVMLISSLVISLGVFLSRRFIPILDLTLIILAAITLSKMKRQYLMGAVAACALWFSINYQSEAKPLIRSDELSEIKQLSSSEEQAYILVADNEYTPWIYGYSDRQVIAPGFGENDRYWSVSEWEDFWSSNNRERERELLSQLPSPLYIYLGDRQRQILFRPEGTCFKRFSWHVYEFVCKN